MPAYVVVNTVNSPLNRLYDFGVHAAGCTDLKRGAARNCQQYPYEDSASADAVIAAESADLAADFGEDHGFSFKVFPCCK